MNTFEKLDSCLCTNNYNDNKITSSVSGEKRLKLTEPKKKSRKFQKIPIYITEYHNDVLEFIYKCFASRHLPINGNEMNTVLTHFDSHPDMIIRRDLKPLTVYNKYELFDKLSIENWIMPACYAGHFRKLIWLKNSWCNQINCGRYDFLIGDHNDRIFVNLPIDYFLLEGNYCNEIKMKNKKEMRLVVINNDDNSGNPVDDHRDDGQKNEKNTQKMGLECEKESNKTNIDKKILNVEGQNIHSDDDDDDSDRDHIILDIDLDFFSTANPFLKIYEKAKCYDKLKEIFSFPCFINDGHNKNTDNTTSSAPSSSPLPPPTRSFEQISEKRIDQLNFLDKLFDYLNVHRNLDNFLNDSKLKNRIDNKNPDDPSSDDDDSTLMFNQLYQMCLELHQTLSKCYDDNQIDWILIKDAGYTCDAKYSTSQHHNELPHHISNEIELKTYYENFELYIKNLNKLPTVVTISRSSEDDYCPKNQVDMIQNNVLEILYKTYGSRITNEPILAYKNDDGENEWDIMKL